MHTQNNSIENSGASYKGLENRYPSFYQVLLPEWKRTTNSKDKWMLSCFLSEQSTFKNNPIT